MERRNERRAEREGGRAPSTAFEPADAPGAQPDFAPDADFVPDAPAEALNFQALEGIEKDVKEKPFDESRPVMVASGYQPPSRWAYVAAFCLFGLSMIFVISVSPQVRYMMWPFDEGMETKFQRDQRPTIQDDNRLRNTGNIRALDMLVQIPTFVLAWGMLITYVYFAARILYSTGKSAWDSYQAKKVYHHAQNKRR